MLNDIKVFLTREICFCEDCSAIGDDAGFLHFLDDYSNNTSYKGKYDWKATDAVFCPLSGKLFN
jgi:hypothetical protein